MTSKTYILSMVSFDASEGSPSSQLLKFDSLSKILEFCNEKIKTYVSENVDLQHYFIDQNTIDLKLASFDNVVNIDSSYGTATADDVLQLYHAPGVTVMAHEESGLHYEYSFKWMEC